MTLLRVDSDVKPYTNSIVWALGRRLIFLKGDKYHPSTLSQFRFRFLRTWHLKHRLQNFNGQRSDEQTPDGRTDGRTARTHILAPWRWHQRRLRNFVGGARGVTAPKSKAKMSTVVFFGFQKDETSAQCPNNAMFIELN